MMNDDIHEGQKEHLIWITYWIISKDVWFPPEYCCKYSISTTNEDNDTVMLLQFWAYEYNLQTTVIIYNGPRWKQKWATQGAKPKWTKCQIINPHGSLEIERALSQSQRTTQGAKPEWTNCQIIYSPLIIRDWKGTLLISTNVE